MAGQAHRDRVKIATSVPKKQNIFNRLLYKDIFYNFHISDHVKTHIEPKYFKFVLLLYHIRNICD